MRIEEIKQYRKRNRISQGEFGDLLGVSAATVSRWETGKDKPTYRHLMDITEILSRDVCDNIDRGLMDEIISFLRRNDNYECRRTLEFNGLSPYETMKLLKILGIDYEKEISSFHRMIREEKD